MSLNPDIYERVLSGTIVDPIFKGSCYHSPQLGKPLARVTRSAAASPDPCPFCLMGAEVKSGKKEISDGEVFRPVLGSNQYAYAISNRWSIFPDPGYCDLVIPYQHVEGLEDLDEKSLVGFFAELETHQERRDLSYSESTIFVNVGAEAGGSIAHLHGQIVSSGDPLGLPVNKIEEESLQEDWDLAKRSNLWVEDTGKSRIWVAASPVLAGEVRFDASSVSEVSFICQKLLAHFTGVPYNLMLRSYTQGKTKRVFGQLIPRSDRGIVYPQLYSINIVTSDLTLWAASLRGE